MTAQIAVDTSVAVPLVMHTHKDHRAMRAWRRGRPLSLTGHSMTETYSVITRLPLSSRVEPHDAATLLRAHFDAPRLLSARTTHTHPDVLSLHGIMGGAVYDALVGLAALEHDCTLATKDAR